MGHFLGLYTESRIAHTDYFISRAYMVALPSGRIERGGIVSTRTDRFIAAAIRRALYPGASFLALGALGAMPLLAQETSDSNSQHLQEVVVTGIRKSLESAQAIKQTSEQIVDSVTAQDIGALPDRSVSEAL